MKLETDQPDFSSLTASIESWPYSVTTDKTEFVLAFRGDPIPSPRPRLSKHHTYMPERYTSYKQILRIHLTQALRSIAKNSKWDTKASIGLRVFFFRKDRHRCDVDNLIKTCQDAGTGVLWDDDSQIGEVFGKIFRDSSDPRVVIYVYQIEDWTERLTCEWCCEQFRVSPSIKAKNRRFCSSKCHIAWENTQTEYTDLCCLLCGINFIIPKRGRWKTRKFCSNKCKLSHLNKSKHSI